MATVKVRMYATVRELAGTSEIYVEATDLKELLHVLSDRLGPRFSRLVSSSEPDDSIVILLNGRNVRPGSVSRTVLSQDDEVCIFPPVSGG